MAGKNKNVLKKTKTYLIGPMQYQCGRSWREEMTEFLSDRGILALDPYQKPFINAIREDEQTQKRLEELLSKEDYENVSKHMKEVRNFDLFMVDKSDFLICYLNPSTPTFGTMEELSWAVRMKRPVFVVIEGGKSKVPLWVLGMLPHKYIYSSFQEVKETLDGIDKGRISLDGDRWRLFKEELR
jgi:nucleoside 2-deoxyribosyltransferase